MENIYIVSDAALYLGRQNEHMARSFSWDISEWVATYGDGDVGILAYRPDDSFSIPVMPEREGNIIKMNVTNVLTAQYGNGVIELRMYRDNEIVKSETWDYRVDPAAGRITGEAPPPIEDYRDEIIRAGGVAASAADRAKNSADAAAGSLEELKQKIASGEFKGDKGDKGDPGEIGTGVLDYINNTLGTAFESIAEAIVYAIQNGGSGSKAVAGRAIAGIAIAG